MRMQILPKKVNPDKCRKPPRNQHRRNLYRHVTYRRKKRGPYRGRVQQLYEKE